MSSEQALLDHLAQALRETRRAAGLSVSELARRAGLSRRTLTELEAGRGNPTLSSLARLASVLGRPLAELCALPVSGPPSARTERVALVGLRGAGKTTVGRRLALALEVPFIELDERIEERAGLSLAEIFDLQGAETFRRLEREVLEDVLAAGGRFVLATSGSIVSSPETYERLRGACRTIWLTATPEEHLARVLEQGDRRPMEGRPRAMDELRSLLAERESRYALSEKRVDTSQREVDEVVEEARGWLEP